MKSRHYVFFGTLTEFRPRIAINNFVESNHPKVSENSVSLDFLSFSRFECIEESLHGQTAISWISIDDSLRTEQMRKSRAVLSSRHETECLKLRARRFGRAVHGYQCPRKEVQTIAFPVPLRILRHGDPVLSKMFRTSERLTPMKSEYHSRD